MITQLRKRHRLAWLVLAIALPVILILALTSRHPVPTDDTPIRNPSVETR